MTAHHSISAHDGLVEIAQRSFMRTHLVIDIKQLFHDSVHLLQRL